MSYTGEPVFDEVKARTALEIAATVNDVAPSSTVTVPDVIDMIPGRWIIVNTPNGRIMILCNEAGYLCQFDMKK